MVTYRNSSDLDQDVFNIGVVPFVPEFSPCFIEHVFPSRTPLAPSCVKTPGSHAETIFYILQYLNATAKYHFYSSNGIIDGSGNATGLLGGFQRNEIDWIGPLWNQNEDRNKFVTFSSAAGDFYRACFLINPIQKVQFINPFASLPIMFWPIISALQLSMAILLWLNTSRTKSVFRSMFTLSFESKNKSKFRTFHSRLIISIWCPSAWILLIRFKGHYVAELSRPLSLPADFSDLDQYIGRYRLQLFEQVAVTTAVLTSTSNEMQSIQKKLQSSPPVKFTTLPAYMGYLLSHKGVIAVAYDAFAMQKAQMYPQLQLTCNDGFNGFGYVGMRRGLSRKVREELNIVTIRTAETGIVTYIKHKYIRPAAKPHGSPSSLEIQSVLPGLLLLALGLLVACLVVAVETWLHESHNRCQ